MMPDMSFSSCDAAEAAGYWNIPRTSPMYWKGGDRDNDGIACEKPGAGEGTGYPTTPVTTKPTPRPTKTKPTPETTKPATHQPTETHTAVAVADQPELPLTGPGEVTIVGGAVLMVGVAFVALFRRRRTRFTA